MTREPAALAGPAGARCHVPIHRETPGERWTVDAAAGQRAACGGTVVVDSSRADRDRDRPACSSARGGLAGWQPGTDPSRPRALAARRARHRGLAGGARCPTCPGGSLHERTSGRRHIVPFPQTQTQSQLRPAQPSTPSQAQPASQPASRPSSHACVHDIPYDVLHPLVIISSSSCTSNRSQRSPRPLPRPHPHPFPHPHPPPPLPLLFPPARPRLPRYPPFD